MTGVSSETMRLILDVQDRMSRELSGAYGYIQKVDNELSKVKSNFKQTSDAGNKLGNMLKNIFNVAAIMMAARYIVDFGKKIITLGSNAEEIKSKFDVVFKYLAKDADQWTKDFSKSVGRSANEMRAYMATFQDTFVPLGFAREQGYEFSKVLTKLGVDLASFNNLAEADVMRDLQSGIVGNTEVFRKYGVVINEATLNQELMNMGVKEGTKAATEAQKAQARLNLLIKGTADAQGDAIRTGGGFANTMRSVSATMERILTGLGAAILPVATQVAQSVNKAMEPFATWIEEHQLQITNFFLHIPQIAGIVFSSILPILKDTLTGADFGKIVGAMVNILIAGFSAAVASFGDLLLAAIKSIPDYLVFIAANMGKILTETLGKAFLPEILKGKQLGVEEYQKATGNKYKGKDLQTAYMGYVKEWERANQEIIQFEKEADAYSATAIQNIFKNMEPVFTNAGKNFQDAWAKIQKEFGVIGTEGLKALDNESMRKMLEEVAKLLNEPLLETAANTKEISETTKAGGEVPGTVTPLNQSQFGQTPYASYKGATPEYGLPQTTGLFDQLGGMDELLSQVNSRLGEFGSSIMTAVSSMGPVGILFALLKPVLDGIFQIISPVIETMLLPLFDSLTAIGIVLGSVILPLLQIISPFLDVFSKALIFLVNKAIIPLANLIILVFKVVANIVVTIWNAIAIAINFLLGWLGVHIDLMEVPDIEEIKPIEPGKSKSASGGNTYYIIVRTDGIIDEEAERRTSLRIARQLRLSGEAGID